MIAGLALASSALAGQDDSAVGPTNQVGFRCDTAEGVVDRVLAVVGDAPILASQIEEEIFTQRAQQADLPKTAE